MEFPDLSRVAEGSEEGSWLEQVTILIRAEGGVSDVGAPIAKTHSAEIAMAAHVGGTLVRIVRRMGSSEAARGRGGIDSFAGSRLSGK